MEVISVGPHEIVAVPVTPPLLAVMLPLAIAMGAVNRPVPDIVPPIKLTQAKFGCVASGLLNWSLPVAANCCCVPSSMSSGDGLTTMVVSVALTTTLTLLVVDKPRVSRRVTVRL